VLWYTNKYICSEVHLKRRAFPERIFSKLTSAEQDYRQTSYAKFHPHGAKTWK